MKNKNKKLKNLPFPETTDSDWRDAMDMICQHLIILGWIPKEVDSLKEEVNDICEFLIRLDKTNTETELKHDADMPEDCSACLACAKAGHPNKKADEKYCPDCGIV